MPVGWNRDKHVIGSNSLLSDGSLILPVEFCSISGKHTLSVSFNFGTLPSDSMEREVGPT